MQLETRLSFVLLLSLSACIHTGTVTLEGNEEQLPEFGMGEHGPLSDPALGLAAGGLKLNYVPPLTAGNLGGEAMSRPCCYPTRSGDIRCYFRGPRSKVWTSKIYEYSWSSWYSLGGIVTSDIECLSAGDYYIFALGERKDFAVYGVDAQGQSKWVSLGASLPEVPTCVPTSDTRIDCILRNCFSMGYRISYAKGKWGAFINLGTPVLKQPFGCGKLSKTRFDCFAVDRDQQIVQVTYNSGKWSHQVATNATVKGRLSVIWSSRDRLDLVGLGPKNDVVHMTWTPDQWSSAVSLGGIFDTDPHCLGLKEGIHCFAVGPDSQLYYNGWNTPSLWVGPEWSGWSRCDIPEGMFHTSKYLYIGPPYCIISSSHKISCFMRNRRREVVSLTFDLD